MFSPQLMAHIVRVEREALPEKAVKIETANNINNDIKFISALKLLLKRYLKIMDLAK